MNAEEVRDKNKWNKFVSTHNPWSVFQLYEWGELHEKLGEKVYRIGIVGETKLLGAAQILVIRARRGTFLHVRHGPVLATTQDSIFSLLLDEVKKIAALEKAWFVRISPMISDSVDNKEFLSHLGFKPSPIHAMDAELCWVLDLNKSETELLMGMRKTTRYLVRQAEKLGVVIHVSTNVEDFKNLYKVTAHRHGFVGHRGIDLEYALFHKQKQAVLLTAKHDGKILASAIILFLGRQAVYHHGASITTKIPASYFLQWYAIREAKKRNCELYNFWGIAPTGNEKHPWKGITLFKQGFGGREVRFLHAHDLALSPFYRLSYTIETIRKNLKGY